MLRTVLLTMLLCQLSHAANQANEARLQKLYQDVCETNAQISGEDFDSLFTSKFNQNDENIGKFIRGFAVQLLEKQGAKKSVIDGVKNLKQLDTATAEGITQFNPHSYSIWTNDTTGGNGFRDLVQAYNKFRKGFCENRSDDSTIYLIFSALEHEWYDDDAI